MKYFLNVCETPFNFPVRIISSEAETLFVVEDLERLIGLDGMAKQLLDTILKSRFEFPNRFRTRELKLKPLEGYEKRIRKQVLVDKAGAYFILANAKINPAVAAGYNDYTNQVANWFYETFGLDEYERYRYEQLTDSIVKPVDDRIGTDYINFFYRGGNLHTTKKAKARF